MRPAGMVGRIYFAIGFWEKHLRPLIQLNNSISGYKNYISKLYLTTYYTVKVVRKWYTTFAVVGYIRGKKWWKWGARIVLFVACPALPTLRQGLLLWDSSIRPTFFDQKR